jgi:transcriptional regulator with XRE-family HTH domain
MNKTPTSVKATRNLTLAVACVVDGRPRYRIASEANIVPQYLSGYITGRLTPSVEHRERLSEVLGIPVNELFPTD